MNQLTFLDESGVVLRDLGIKRAADHTESIHPGWQRLALGYVREYACRHKQFLGEDVRLYAEKHGLPEPSHKRAWGAVMLAAVRAGVIERIGTAPVKNATAHRAFASVWGTRV